MALYDDAPVGGCDDQQGPAAEMALKLGEEAW